MEPLDNLGEIEDSSSDHSEPHEELSEHTTTAPVSMETKSEMLEAEPNRENDNLRTGPISTESSFRSRTLHLEMASLSASISQRSSSYHPSFDSTERGSSGATPSSVVRSTINRSNRERQLVHALGPEGAAAPSEALNQKAVTVIRRVQSKLTGRDFDDQETLNVSAQVQRLINQATSHENLCQCYIGWCPFW